MPEKSDRADDNDDVRKRFAAVSTDEAAAAHDDLPDVPEIRIERPGQKPKSVSGSATVISGGEGKLPKVRGMYGSSEMRSSGQALTIGTSLVASIIVGTAIGWLIDKYVLHSTGTPWGLICGFMLGVVSGFVQLVRVANQLNKD